MGTNLELLDGNNVPASFSGSFFTLGESLPEPITSPEIEEFMPIMDNVVSDLKESFQNGVYCLLVGEDKSGRIPALVLREVINHANVIAGRPPIPTVFVKWGKGRIENIKQASNNLHPLKSNTTGGKALIVTEDITTGCSIGNLGEMINKAGLQYDIATLALIFDRSLYSNIGKIVGQVQIFPKSGCLRDRPLIERNKHLTGLTGRWSVVVDPEALRSDVLTARKDVIKAGGQLISKHITPDYLNSELYKSRIRSMKYLRSRLKTK